ncbi:uncharacterized protein LOC121262184 [Juglans microcarpa x Juglans regia]|uniref:uncharacterized protein LOC121262184 n=1 Tax=Juglans microcarpa x Juglans regia TaxID=2249226 RepID=UPI001B7EA61A|nr:uncharacterized protein LOC121262184 [Juglans microcarpa x Juglans regia]
MKLADGKPILEEGLVTRKTTKNEPETVILIAARNGVAEIVEKILEVVPVATHDVNAENKNALLLAVENRQPHIYKLLLERNTLNKDSVFLVVDNEVCDEVLPSKIVLPRCNDKGKTPEDLFIENHKKLVTKGREWLSSSSQSYSVLAGIIATVSFATSSSVPGGLKEGIGTPNLERQLVFHLFAISSLIALSFSITALVAFLAILTSRHQESDFGKDLPRKFFVGLTSLFVSIVAILISFCAGNLLQTKDNILRYVEFPVYLAACLPIAYFAVVHFPLYFDLTLATFTTVPRRSFDVVL